MASLGIIFDLDGTLLHTAKEVHYICNYSLNSYGFKSISIENVMKYMGDGARDLTDRMLDEVGGDKAVIGDKFFNDYMSNYSMLQGQRIELFDGILDTLKTLEKNGVALAVLSNKPDVNTQIVVKKYFPEINFKYILGGSNRFPLKPAPDSLLHIIDSMGLTPEQCCYVGDGDADVLVAKNANVKGVSCLWGYRSREFLERFGAVNFIDEPSQLLNV